MQPGNKDKRKGTKKKEKAQRKGKRGKDKNINIIRSSGEDIATWLLRLTHLHCQAQVHRNIHLSLSLFIFISWSFETCILCQLRSIKMFIFTFSVHFHAFLSIHHFFFMFQGLTKIADLSVCSNITVLYLYSNKITRIGKS